MDRSKDRAETEEKGRAQSSGIGNASSRTTSNQSVRDGPIASSVAATIPGDSEASVQYSSTPRGDASVGNGSNCTAEAVASSDTGTRRSPSENPSPALNPTANEESTTESQASNEETDSSKKEKPKLRKGKWTIEEEEYTSRIIQYFGTGLLTLPDGATLRSYLAEKLNCDPMRITKKFTGACCLGRRAYHLRDRPRPSPTEVEIARLELQHLEHRFRLRVEHEQSGLPLPPRHELLAAQPPTSSSTIPSIASLFSSFESNAQGSNAWIQNQAHPGFLPNPSAVGPAAGALPGNTGSLGFPPGVFPPFANGPLGAEQVLFQVSNDRISPASTTAAPPGTPIQVLNNIVASLALAQASARLNQTQGRTSVTLPSALSTSISPFGNVPEQTTSPPAAAPAVNFAAAVNPSLPKPVAAPLATNQHLQFKPHQLPSNNEQAEQKKPTISPAPCSANELRAMQLKAAFEEQQKALRLAYEKSLREAEEEEPHAMNAAAGTTTATKTDSVRAPQSTNKPMSAAEQLRRSYEAHLASLQSAGQDGSPKMPSASSAANISQPQAKSNSVEDSATSERAGAPEGKRTGENSQGKLVDEEAGTILLGFLNSLRDSYEDAVGGEAGKQSPAVVPGTKQKKNSKNSEQLPAAPSKKQDVSSAKCKVSKSETKPSPKNPAGGAEPHEPGTITSSSLSRFNTSKRMKPASVTETSSGTSSQPTTEQSSSSLDDSDSKSDKTEQSSSDESEKMARKRHASKGPPRKRLKEYHQGNEFTRENLLEHSKRMDLAREGSVNSADSDG